VTDFAARLGRLQRAREQLHQLDGQGGPQSAREVTEIIPGYAQACVACGLAIIPNMGTITNAISGGWAHFPCSVCQTHGVFFQPDGTCAECATPAVENPDITYPVTPWLEEKSTGQLANYRAMCYARGTMDLAITDIAPRGSIRGIAHAFFIDSAGGTRLAKVVVDVYSSERGNVRHNVTRELSKIPDIIAIYMRPGGQDIIEEL
jgi:hypothetical protein